MAARDEIYECLEELSRPILSDDKVPWSDDGAAAEAADDTADEGGTK